MVDGIILIAVACFLVPLRDWLRRGWLPLRMVGSLVTAAVWVIGLLGALFLGLWVWGDVAPLLR